MSGIQSTKQKTATIVDNTDLNLSSMRILQSLLHTITLLEKTTGGKIAEAPPFLSDWVAETYAMLKQFSSRVEEKMNRYGHQGFDPALHIAVKQGTETNCDLQSLIYFKNSFKK